MFTVQSYRYSHEFGFRAHFVGVFSTKLEALKAMHKYKVDQEKGCGEKCNTRTIDMTDIEAIAKAPYMLHDKEQIILMEDARVDTIRYTHNWGAVEPDWK